MTERLFRFVLLLTVVLLFVPFFQESRGARVREATAFLRHTSGSVVLRVSGQIPQPGIYRFCDGVTVKGVMEMTLSENGRMYAADKLFGTRLHSGQILDIRGRDGQCTEITIKNMRAQEYVLLGIPLNPDNLTFDDWLSLPGIGPSLANAIILDRHQNGAFGSVDGLLRVPGIGNGKLNIISKFF